MGRTITLSEIGERSVNDLLREVARLREPLHVVLEDGATIDIKPSPVSHSENGETTRQLKPLTVLSGYVPAGWKDAIYDFSDSES